MALTADEERQLEYLLRKKYGSGEAAEELPSVGDLPASQISDGSAKVHGDKLDVEPGK